MKEELNQANEIIQTIKKVIIGKQDAVEKTMMAILAGGHILMQDIPGIGKTTMALSFSKTMGLKQSRVQFTPDVMPADITGFSVFDKTTGSFNYEPGAVMCNLFLADEINRTSPKTQSALLEVMAEGQVSVDGQTHEVEKPFVVIATANPEGSAGTQLLPDSQLDRFMICLQLGYPTIEEEIAIMKINHDRAKAHLNLPVMTNAQEVLEMQKKVKRIFIHDKMYQYIARLVKETRNEELLSVGLSPRAAVAITQMAQASAFLNDREFIVPEDISNVFYSVANHRVVLSPKARVTHVKVEDLLGKILENVKAPTL